MCPCPTCLPKTTETCVPKASWAGDKYTQICKRYTQDTCGVESKTDEYPGRCVWSGDAKPVDKCSTVKCDAGTVCKDGKCVNDVCPKPEDICEGESNLNDSVWYGMVEVCEGAPVAVSVTLTFF